MSTSKPKVKTNQSSRHLHSIVSWGTIILMAAAGGVAFIWLQNDTSMRNLLLMTFILLPLLSAVGLGIPLFLSWTRTAQLRDNESRATDMLEQLMPDLDPLPDLQLKIKPVMTLPLWLMIGLLLPIQQVFIIAAVALLPYDWLSSVGSALMWITPLATIDTLIRCWGMIRRYLARKGQLFDEDTLVPLLTRIALEFFIQMALLSGLFGLFYLLKQFIAYEFIAFLIAVFIFVKILPTLYVLRIALPIGWAMAPWQRLDYDEALARSRRLRDVLRITEPELLADMGHDQQARTRFFEILQEIRPRSHVNAWELAYLSHYGMIAHLTGQHREAIKALELATELIPSDTDGLATLAEAYLILETEPARALELTETALKLRRRFRPLVNRTAHFATPEIRAMHVWALAANGACDQARSEANRARSEAKGRPPHQIANVYVRVGYALVLCDDESARQHLELSARMDPRGWSGRLARRALAQ